MTPNTKAQARAASVVLGLLWWTAVTRVIRGIGAATPGHRIDSLAVDGTSGTLLLADDQGMPLEPEAGHNEGA